MTGLVYRSVSMGRAAWLVVLAGAAMSLSCTANALLSVSAPTSDFQPGSGLAQPRVIQVGFINNTPFRAIFTFGAFDPLDRETVPLNLGQLRLEGNTSSAQIAQPCRKTFSVGGDELVRLINQERNNPNINIIDPAALVRGVNFSGAPLGDPLEPEPTEGTAQGIDVLAGIDFTCERTDIRDQTGTGLLLFTFEEDPGAPGGFRIDFSFVQP